MSREETLEARTPTDSGLELHFVFKDDADPVFWLKFTQEQSEEPENLWRETRRTLEVLQMAVNCSGVRKMNNLSCSEQIEDTAG